MKQRLLWNLLIGHIVPVFAVIALLSRSWLRGLYSMLPSLLAVAAKFAVMGWAGLRLAAHRLARKLQP